MKMAVIAGLVLGLSFFGAARGAEIGPPVGTQAPMFTALDSTGSSRALRTLMGPKGVVLVFYRSAQWCPYCQTQLMALRDAAGPLAERGYRLAAISYDPPAALGAFVQRRQINFPLLSDQGSQVIDAFALRDRQYKPGSMAYGVPEPSIFVIDPRGKVLAKLAEEGYRSRPTNEAVVEAVDRLRP